MMMIIDSDEKNSRLYMLVDLFKAFKSLSEKDIALFEKLQEKLNTAKNTESLSGFEKDLPFTLQLK